MILLHGGRRSAAAAPQQRHAASGCEQCHVVSRRGKLNTDLILHHITQRTLPTCTSVTRTQQKIVPVYQFLFCFPAIYVYNCMML